MEKQMEVRPHHWRDWIKEHGRSTVQITCPLCGTKVIAYNWSLAGSGKKCSCGALHGMGRSLKPINKPEPMKQKNFRIIDLEKYQVLLMKDWDDEDQNPVITVILFVEGAKIQQTMGYKDEKVRDQIFDDMTHEKIQGLISGVVAVFEKRAKKKKHEAS